MDRPLLLRWGRALPLVVALLVSGDAAAQAPPAAPAPGCLATTHGSFHLRPKAQRKSAGPKLPKGTELAVLTRLPPPEKGDSRPIYQVRVKTTGATGYAYLRQREMGPGCPFIWPGTEELKAGELVKPLKSECVKPGPAKTAAALFRKSCSEGKPLEENEGKKLDLNGDGRDDWVLVIDDSSDKELAVVLSTPAGYRGLVLEGTEGRDTKGYSVDAIVRAGKAAYIVLNEANWENETNDEGEIEQLGYSNFTFYRIAGDGRFYKVFVLNSDDNTMSCTYDGRADESVLLKCDGGSVHLRWDAGAKVLRAALD